MGSDVSVKIEGLDDLETRLKAIAKQLSENEFLEAGKDGMIAHVEGPAKRRTKVDTGRLRNSEATVIDKSKKQVITGTNVEYAPYVEYGTSRQSAQPFLRPSWDEGKEKVVEHMETVAQSKIKGVI